MYQIDESIIKKAVNCDRNFECTTEENQPSCKIKYCVGGEVHFLEELCRPCPYFIGFAQNEIICTCPVRKEIYNKYKV